MKKPTAIGTAILIFVIPSRANKKSCPQAAFSERETYFFRAYFSESNATAKIIIAPLMMYCQYGFTPI